MSSLLEEYERAYRNLLLDGTPEEKDKIHLFDSGDMVLSFLMGSIAIVPIILVGLLLL